MGGMSGGDLVARVLAQAGVGHVFTLCGGHILPIYGGCLREGIRVIELRHEQAAAHAADASARLTRNIGVAVVTAGPGVTDAVTGVANAYSARSPLLLIGGAAPLGLRGLGALQETEQVALLRPITKGSWTVAETRQIPEVLTTAIRAALSGRPGPVFVEIPVDLLLTTVEDRLAPIPTGYVHRTRAAVDAEALGRLDALLAGAERPVMMAGGGVYWDDAAKSLASFAERAGVPVFMNGAGRGALATDHPNAFFQTRGWALGHADVVLVLGTPLDLQAGLRQAADVRRGREGRDDRRRSGRARAQPPARARPRGRHRRDPAPADRRAAARPGSTRLGVARRALPARSRGARKARRAGRDRPVARVPLPLGVGDRARGDA